MDRPNFPKMTGYEQFRDMVHYVLEKFMTDLLDHLNNRKLRMDEMTDIAREHDRTLILFIEDWRSLEDDIETKTIIATYGRQYMIAAIQSLSRGIVTKIFNAIGKVIGFYTQHKSKIELFLQVGRFALSFVAPCYEAAKTILKVIETIMEHAGKVDVAKDWIMAKIKEHEVYSRLSDVRLLEIFCPLPWLQSDTREAEEEMNEMEVHYKLNF